MTYTVIVLRPARKVLAKIPAKDRANVQAMITSLADTPRPHGCIKLTDSTFWRIRVGNYRIIYQIQDTLLVVTVAKIQDRKDAY